MPSTQPHSRSCAPISASGTMIKLPECEHSKRRKHGKTKSGTQRYRCSLCGATFTESTNILDGMRIGLDRAEMILKCLLEGLSINATSRITSTDPHTIYDLIVLVGGRCKRYMEETIKDVYVDDVQADEIWSFVFCKERTRKQKDYGGETGDAYCWTAIERNTKLFVAWHLGKRSLEASHAFTEKLSRAVHPECRFHFSTDGLRHYHVSVMRNLTGRVNYGQIVKVYGKSEGDDKKYSPPQIIRTRKHVVLGNPNPDQVCTSHVERSNLTIRMELRRFTRLTNAFSKKWSNHESALALFFCHYNFCRKHTTIETSPAVESGLDNRIWSVRDLVLKTCNT